MFGMGFTEILMIAVVAVVFLGPEKLPKFLVDAAKFFKSVKRAIDNAKNSIEEEVRISELKEEALKYKEKLGTVDKEMKELKHLSDLDSFLEEENKKLTEIQKTKEKTTKEIEDKDKVDV
jgi:sec-independent protein translocase protein TatB